MSYLYTLSLFYRLDNRRHSGTVQWARVGTHLIMRRALQGLIAPLLALAAWGGMVRSERFKERTSGHCTDEREWTWLESKAECEEGARALGRGDTSAESWPSPRNPPGCFTWGLSGSLSFNTETSSTMSCSTSHLCICTLLIRACKITDGSAPNSADDNTPCICGKQACTSNGNGRGTGLICTLTSSTCSRPDMPCKITNGTSANDDACRCGSADCEKASTTGMFCMAELNMCSKDDIFPAPDETAHACKITDRSARNDNSCICGDHLLCSSNSFCSYSTDGKTNSGCSCDTGGTTTCASWEVCNPNTETCLTVQNATDCGNSATSSPMPNCVFTNTRCQCVTCKAGFYTSDCSAVCPDSIAVGVCLDILFFSVGSWLFLGAVYFTFRVEEVDSSDDGGTSTARAKSAMKKSRKDARKFRRLGSRLGSSMRPVLIGQMQIVSSILSGIHWSPDMPQFFINFLSFFANVFTLDFLGLMSSPDCAFGEGTPMTPLNKWYMSMCFPWVITLVFCIWYCVACSPATKETVATAGVQVVVVGFFTFIVTNCLKILDCDGDTLILDPSLMCPYHSGDISLIVLGVSIFIIFAILPIIRLTKLSFGMDYDDMMVKCEESTSFRVKYGWAIKEYRTSRTDVNFTPLPPENWESFNMFVKIITVMGSVVMYSENRRIAQMCITTLSLVLHAKVRPYKDNAGNITVVLFCLCEILGIFATSSMILQILFITSLFLTVAVVIYFALKAARGRIHDISSASDAHVSKYIKYSPLEKKLLFPIFAIVWLVSKVAMVLCKIERAKQSQTSIVPRETEAYERADVQHQADPLLENRDAVQKLQEVREQHGADSEEYKAKREMVILAEASNTVKTADTDDCGMKLEYHHKRHHKRHHKHKKHAKSHHQKHSKSHQPHHTNTRQGELFSLTTRVPD